MKSKNNTFQYLGFIALAFAGFAATSAHADTALTAGHTIIDTTGNPALGVISRAAGATALFNNNGIATATGTPLVNGILGPWAFIATGTASRYATLDGSNNVVGYTGGTSTTWGGTINSATTNYEISAIGSATYGGTERVANTIRYTGGAGSVISLGNSSAVGLTVNGLINAGTGTLTFNHGGGALAGAGIHIGATKELVLNAANAAITINARIHNNGAVAGVGGDASAVTVVGTNTVTLSSASTYTGPTTISAGRLNVISPGSIATSAVALGAATLGGNGSVGAVTANNVGSIITNGNGNTNTLNLASLAFSASGTMNLNLASDTFTPAVAVTNTLDIGSGFTVNVTTAPSWTTGQTYNLINYGTLSGTFSNIIKGTISGLAARQIATLGNTDSTNGSITLAITGVTPLWTGAQSNAWTTAIIAGSKNWKIQDSLPVQTTDFLTNDQVLFDDTATGNTSVNISTANVQVASVLFNNSGVNNSGLDYTISSTGGFGIADGSNPASLVKNGDGTVTLKTINSYTGVTTINAGTLRLGDGTTDGDIASSSSIVNNGTLILNRSTGSFSYANVVSGFGQVVKTGTGTQIFSGSNTYSGGTTINAGTVQVGAGGTTGALGTGFITFTNNSSLVFNRSDALVVNGLIEGTGSVTQAGTGAVTLSGFNGYSGGTLLNSGTIVVTNNSALGSGLVTLAGGTLSGTTGADTTLANALVAQASTTSGLFTNGKNLTLNGNLTGSGNINRTATGAAATVFLGGDNSGFSGTFTVDANGSAATRFSAATAGSQAAKWVINQSVNGRASLDFAGGTIKFGSLTGTGFLTSAGLGINTMEVGALGLSETFPGVLNQGAGSTLAVTKVGAGTWTLTGTNTYTGDTTVNAGVLAVDGDAIANANKLVINGGKVDPMGATEVVNTLYFGVTQQASGTWGATGSGAAHIDDTHFTGTGVVSVTTAPVAGYSSWAAANGATGQTMDQDHDNDGVKNGIEYFMGQTGSTFTANPTALGGTVTWLMGGTYTGVYGTDYEVQSSTDLAIWTKVEIGSGDNTVTVNPGPTPARSVVYDVPTGGKSFVRLVVKN